MSSQGASSAIRRDHHHVSLKSEWNSMTEWMIAEHDRGGASDKEIVLAVFENSLHF
eukprot:IDg20111t1